MQLNQLEDGSASKGNLNSEGYIRKKAFVSLRCLPFHRLRAVLPVCLLALMLGGGILNAALQAQSNPRGASAPSGSPRGATKRAATSAATSTGLSATATSPDYSQIGNALAGVTFLMRQDDLVVNLGQLTFFGTPLDLYYTSLFGYLTSDSNGTQCVCGGYNSNFYTQDTAVTIGRFFHTVQDASVAFPSTDSNHNSVVTLAIGSTDNGNPNFHYVGQQPLPYTTGDTIVSHGYAADFNGDGYDELLMTYSDYSKVSAGNARVRFGAAYDINDPSQGFNFGIEQTLGFPEGIRATAIGDFNGDGQPDIAVLRVTVDNNLHLSIYSVDPQTLMVSNEGQDVVVDTLSDNGLNQPIQLAAGHFTGSTNQQLVVADQSALSGTIQLRVFDFASNSYQPVVQQTADTGAIGITNMKLLTSKFAWNSPYDVISLMLTKVDGGSSWSYVYLYTVNTGSYAMTLSSVVDVATTYSPHQNDKGYVALDIAVGNFNNLKPNPADPSQKINDPNLQLAVAVAVDEGNQTNGHENFQYGRIGIVQVGIDPKTGAITLATGGTNQVMRPGGQWSERFQKLTINPADLQGRSMRLGGGFKIKVEQTQPSMILAAPPMHVDYVTPGTFDTPTVLNFSMAPDAFYSKFELDTTNGTSYQHGDTTSSSFSGAEKIFDTTTLGETNSAGQLENGVEISASFEAKQDLANSQELQYGELSSNDVDISQQTSLGDVLWFSDNTYYLYVFEVVGHTVCPGGQASCDDSARVPLTMMFSTPAVSKTQHISAETQEWYQPLWEYGNILSYPGSYEQLQQQNPNLDTPLNNSNSNSFATDGSSAIEAVTIVSGGTTSVTEQASQLFTETGDLSVTGAVSNKLPIPGFGESVGVSDTFGLDLSFGGSTGTSSLKVATTTSQASNTMTITKTASFQTPGTYQYELTPIIFGEQAPVGVDTNSTLGATYPDKVTYGPLRTGFTVDPLGQNGSSEGSFWGQNYQKPDIGLNHPNRWVSTSTFNPTKGTVPLNCISLGTQATATMDCVTQQTRDADNPWGDLFHHMLGFFITEAAHPGMGQQLTTAVAGDQLSLQARVYNYSFAASGTVHVMFYAMKVDSSNYPIPDPTSGQNSFFIGEDWLTSIPGFSAAPNAPLNSQLAHITFDTTGFDDTNLVFWVAVFQVDDYNNLILDPPGKGFSNPIIWKNWVNFAEVAAQEEMVNNPLADPTDPTEPAQTTFSNNLGLYHAVFYVQEKSAAAVPSTSARSSALEQTLQGLKELHDVSAVKVDVAKPSIKLGKGSEVFAILRDDSEAMDNLLIYFYDGDPAQGGTLFDSERVAHLRANQNHRVSVVYHPQQCGMHPLFVRVTKGGFVGATVSAETPLRVTCLAPDPRDQTPPTLQVTLTPATLSPANGQMVPVTAQIQVSDDQDPRPDVRLESITENEASDTSHDVAWAKLGADSRSFLLRAAHTSDNPQGRVYKVVYSATDWAGNVTKAEADVTVPPDQTASAAAKRP